MVNIPFLSHPVLIITYGICFRKAVIRYTGPSCKGQVIFHIRVSGGITEPFIVPVEKSGLELSLVSQGDVLQHWLSKQRAAKGNSRAPYPSRAMGSETIKGYLIQDQRGGRDLKQETSRMPDPYWAACQKSRDLSDQ